MFHNRIITMVGLVVFALCVYAVQVSAQSVEEKNTAAVKRFYDEVMGKGDMKAIDALVADNFVDHFTPDPKIPGNKAGLTQVMTAMRTAFPDLQMTIDDIIAKGDKVWVYSTMRGTNKGEFMGMPATGKKVEVKGVDIVRFENGKAAEHWGLNDDYTMMQQLGVIPAPGQEKTKQ